MFCLSYTGCKLGGDDERMLPSMGRRGSVLFCSPLFFGNLLVVRLEAECRHVTPPKKKHLTVQSRMADGSCRHSRFLSSPTFCVHPTETPDHSLLLP